jgi:hypothetical protein
MFSRTEATDQHNILATGILLQNTAQQVMDVLEDEDDTERDTRND